MEKKTPNELLLEAEQQLVALQRTFAQLNLEIKQLEEENNRLRMNNAELKQQIIPVIEQSFNEQPAPFETLEDPKSGKGYESLQNFYQDGIHVCHEFFGSRLEPGEECLFCVEVLKRLKS